MNVEQSAANLNLPYRNAHKQHEGEAANVNMLIQKTD